MDYHGVKDIIVMGPGSSVLYVILEQRTADFSWLLTGESRFKAIVNEQKVIVDCMGRNQRVVFVKDGGWPQIFTPTDSATLLEAKRSLSNLRMGGSPAHLWILSD